MTESFDRLEREMSQMRPRGITEGLAGRIEASLADDQARHVWADRCLLGAMSAGALAACVIVAMLLMPLLQDLGNPPASTRANVAASAPRVGDYSLAFVQADDRWMDSLK